MKHKIYEKVVISWKYYSKCFYSMYVFVYYWKAWRKIMNNWRKWYLIGLSKWYPDFLPNLNLLFMISFRSELVAFIVLFTNLSGTCILIRTRDHKFLFLILSTPTNGTIIYIMICVNKRSEWRDDPISMTTRVGRIREVGCSKPCMYTRVRVHILFWRKSHEATSCNQYRTKRW